MTSFAIYKQGKEEGTIEVTNRGVSILTREGCGNFLEEIGEDFKMVDSEKCGEDTNYIFKATLPTHQMIEVLTRLKLYLEDVGYEIESYGASQSRSSSMSGQKEAHGVSVTKLKSAAIGAPDD